ncbi:uncharacterized protein YbjT (DUF2867 family) [Kineosphaera limosa]|uniref:Putative oxidoreductase n=1 Tax=Kineosphaera limosa NBRC 100340 TaxID=1184609 RepID=K6VI72_9MICO|nr:SDR family oxidoreductase [Kineosphaera limosa]NYE01284.1 uncharacterized protein YbjT (DUF2867 family) [Kineosphaera limosa]GAB95918.1 putative oxidoreductase [Kineosphaera limosa NBRC 100340]
MQPIAVTGSTGKLGGRIAARLAAAGVPQRLLVRDPSRAPDLPQTEVMQASYGDFEAVRAGLEGVATALLISASESTDRVAQHRTFIDAAAAAGVEHVVYVSFYGASATAMFTLSWDHAATEEHLRDSGLAFTFLRDNFYADFMPDLAGEDGVIAGPAGDGRVAVVAQDDIADSAVAVLTDPVAHRERLYTLTGPESLTLTEIAAILTDALGRPIRYEPQTVEQAYASRASFGAPDWQVDAWVSTYTAIAAGEVARVSPDVQLLIQRPPRSLAEVIAGAPASGHDDAVGASPEGHPPRW